LLFRFLAFQILEAISPIPTVIPSAARNPYPAKHGGGRRASREAGKSSRMRKLVLLLYQPEIGKPAMFADFIFPLDARS
jgi:hypothetical protein